VANTKPRWARSGASPLRNAKESLNRYRYGIMVRIKGQEGQIGQFNLVNLLNILVKAAVMLGVSGTVATMVAKYLLGKKSEVYNSAINERLCFSRELARFSAQALVAKNCFAVLDRDGSGRVTEKELGVQLQDILAAEMDEHGVAACAKAIFNVLEDGSDVLGSAVKVAPSPEDEPGISVFDLIHVLQNDRLTWSDFKQYILADAKEEEKLQSEKTALS
ncbi:unnamed protein product, partial [Polarella glacialis]